MAKTETDSLNGCCSPLKTLTITCLSDPYLPLSEINTWRTQAIKIIQSLMKSSWKRLVEWAGEKCYNLTEGHLSFPTCYLHGIELVSASCTAGDNLILLCIFFDCVANRKGICLRERQTSNAGLRQHSCQWEMGSSDGSPFQALTTLPSVLIHLVIGESRWYWNTWCFSVFPSWVAPACGKCIQCYSAAVCWASWPCCVFDLLLTCLALSRVPTPGQQSWSLWPFHARTSAASTIKFSTHKFLPPPVLLFLLTSMI